MRVTRSGTIFVLNQPGGLTSLSSDANKINIRIQVYVRQMLITENNLKIRWH